MSETGWRRDVWAIAEALFAREDGPPPAERLRWLCDDMADFLEHAGGRARTVFHACRTSTSWLAPPLIGVRPPLHRLPVAERARALATMERGPLAGPFLGLKALLSMIWYEHPDAAAEIGHDARCKEAR